MLTNQCILYNFHGNTNDIKEFYNKITAWVSVEKPNLEYMLIGAFRKMPSKIPTDCVCCGKFLELGEIYPINNKKSEFNFYVDMEVTKMFSIIIDINNWDIDFDYMNIIPNMVMGG